MCVGLSSIAHAQLAVGGVIAVSTHPQGSYDHILAPGFGGTSLGTVIFVDGPVKANIRAGAEVSLAKPISGSQHQRAGGGDYNEFVSEHRDTVIAGVLKVAAWTARRVEVAVVGGGGVARRETNRIGMFRPLSTRFPATPFAEQLRDTVFAATGGLDLSLARGNHFAVVALGRLHLLADRDEARGSNVKRGVSSYILRYGIGARVRF